MSEIIYQPIGLVFKDIEGNLHLRQYGYQQLPFSSEEMDKIFYPGISKKDLELKIASIDREAEESYEEEKLLQTEKPPKKGFVYAVVCGNKIKLGRTINTKTRFKAYEKVCDNFEVISVSETSDYIEEEQLLIGYFGGEVGKSGWFDYSEKLANEVNEYFIHAIGGVVNHA